MRNIRSKASRYWSRTRTQPRNLIASPLCSLCLRRWLSDWPIRRIERPRAQWPGSGRKRRKVMRSVVNIACFRALQPLFLRLAGRVVEGEAEAGSGSGKEFTASRHPRWRKRKMEAGSGSGKKLTASRHPRWWKQKLEAGSRSWKLEAEAEAAKNSPLPDTLGGGSWKWKHQKIHRFQTP